MFDAEVELSQMLSKSSLPQCKESGDADYTWHWNNCLGIATGQNRQFMNGGIWSKQTIAVYKKYVDKNISLDLKRPNEIYVGEFVDGNFQGQGIFVGEDGGGGFMYTGEFFDDEFHGKGTKIFSYGPFTTFTKLLLLKESFKEGGTRANTIKGVWENGELVEE